MGITGALITAIILFTSSCHQPIKHSSKTNYTKVERLQKGYLVNQDQLEGKLELFTFQAANTIYPRWGRPYVGLGKVFIADNKMWTAVHLYHRMSLKTNDTLILGDSPIHGLMTCKDKHNDGAWFFYKTERGVIRSVVVEQDGLFYTVSCQAEIKVGDSGSPVTCEDHNKVVGVVSHFYPNRYTFKDIKFVGRFSRITNAKPKINKPTNIGITVK
jgi:hypothetical protein